MMAKKRIYINPGHSNTDPGAVGFERERDLAVKVSYYMNMYLLNTYECETKVTDGSINSLNVVCKEANDWKADLFVSNHFNAGKGNGYEGLVYSIANLSLGQMFEKYMIAAGQNSRGVKCRPDLAVLRQTNMPAVLNEGAFVDNWNDIKDWNDDAELKKMGEAYAKAAADYLDLPKKVKAPTATSSTVKETYTLKQFIKDVQKSCGAKVDGIAGPETLSKTVTVSAKKNSRHVVVKYIQKRLYALGYTQVGTADGSAGPKFTAAVKAFQKDNDCTSDGVITAKNKTWRELLGM
jgi:N-acetylmuramoyl-L-alanine amidase